MERRNGRGARWKEVPRPHQSIDCRENPEVRFTWIHEEVCGNVENRLSGEDETTCIMNDIKKSYAGF